MDKLAAHLEKDPTAADWARDVLAGEAYALELEQIRWNLTNNELKPQSKSENPDWASLGKLALVTAVYDRANACTVMKLDRNAEDCPRGFLWISQADLAGLAEKPKFGDVEQSFSIARAYIAVAEHCPEVRDMLLALCQPRRPAWILLPWIELF